MKTQKTIIAFFFLLLIPFHFLFSQDNEKLTGNWMGTLKVSSIELRVVFKVTGEGDSLKATLDSPDQGAFGIPVDSIIFDDQHVKFVVSAVKGFFEGNLEQDSISGNWNQGTSLPLT